LISEVEDILHFSEFGVVLLLFVIGLELEPRKLWSMRRPIFGWGGAQVGLVALALCAAAMLAGVHWKVALIAALGLSLSSTAIALATLEERKLLSTPAGGAGFSILLFQDIAAIPMIAIVPLLGVAAVDKVELGWDDAVRIAAVLLALVASGRCLVNPLLRIIAKTNMREIFTGFALLLVISIALLMQWVGLSMALGAFMAGVLLADSEYRHALESDLEPFKGLLLGLFFIAVGMSVDFGAFFAQPWLIIGLVAGFLGIKTAVLYGLARCFDLPRGQQSMFAILLSQGGEFAFVVFGAAATAKVFSPNVASVLVVVVALSMMSTPLLLILHDKFIAPRFASGGKKRKADAIEAQEGHVIIAGFGRFGQIIGRLLRASQVPVTVLDHDPDQIDLLRKFGIQVFYGDATRMDLMRSAGIAKARALVVALDGMEDGLALIDSVRKEYPGLTILARARNVTHFFNLRDRGVTLIERETFEAALQLGEKALQHMGWSAERANEAKLKFRSHNLKSLEDLYPVYKDQQQMVSQAKQARDELDAMFARDLADQEPPVRKIGQD
jgi:glutathione-regulated potassium-efflux system ancillary protein KefC